MIELKKVSKAFDDKVIFKDLNLSFNDNQLIGLFGSSGCGKTTLLNMISMLDINYTGDILVNDINLKDVEKKKKEMFRTKNFSYIFSEPNLLNYLNVKENALLPLKFQDKHIFDDELYQLSDSLGITSLLDHEIDTLSEGEKQRVSILRALVTKSKIIICDEPTAHLDHENSEKIVKILKQISRDNNILIIMSCHDESLCDLFDKKYKFKDKNIYEF